MDKVVITLYGHDYAVNCDAGQEARLKELATLVQDEMKTVVDKVGNATETRLLMLTCLSLADKLLESRSLTGAELAKQEDLFVAAVDHLKDRVATLALQMGRA